MECILDANVEGESTDSYNNPYNSAYNDEFYGYINDGMNKAITYFDNERDGIYSANYFDDNMLDDFDYFRDEQNDQIINLYI